MRDFRSSTTFDGATTGVNPLHMTQSEVTQPMGASQSDLLLYIADLLAELEAIAKQAKIAGVADLLGYAQREVERSRQQL